MGRRFATAKREQGSSRTVDQSKERQANPPRALFSPDLLLHCSPALDTLRHSEAYLLRLYFMAQRLGRLMLIGSRGDR